MCAGLHRVTSICSFTNEYQSEPVIRVESQFRKLVAAQPAFNSIVKRFANTAQKATMSTMEVGAATWILATYVSNQLPEDGWSDLLEVPDSAPAIVDSDN